MINLTKTNGCDVFVDPVAIKLVASTDDNLTLVSGKGFSNVCVNEPVEEVLGRIEEALFEDFISDPNVDDAEVLSLQLERANEMIVGLKDKMDLYVTAVDAIEGSLEKFFNGNATHFLNTNELSRELVETIAVLDEGLEEFGEDE